MENEGEGVETIGGDGSETGLVMTKKGEQKSTSCIGASLTPDYRDKEVSVPASPGIKRRATKTLHQQ